MIPGEEKLPIVEYDGIRYTPEKLRQLSERGNILRMGNIPDSLLIERKKIRFSQGREPKEVYGLNLNHRVPMSFEEIIKDMEDGDKIGDFLKAERALVEREIAELEAE